MSQVNADKTTIIDSQMDRLAEPLSIVCRNLLIGMPKGETYEKETGKKIISEYLEKFFENDYPITLAITQMALAAAEIPIMALDIIDQALPLINIHSTDKSSFNARVNFLGRVKDLNWEDKTTRIVVFLLIDYIKASFVYQTYHISGAISEDEAPTMAGLIIQHILDTGLSDEDLCFLYISCRLWGKALHELSAVSPTCVKQNVLNFIREISKTGTTISPYIRCIKQALFSNVTLSTLTQTEINEVGSALEFSSLFNKETGLWIYAKNSNQSGPIHKTCIEFLMNFYAAVFESTPAARSDSFIKSGYDKASDIVSKRDYIGPAFACRARILSYNKNPKLKITPAKYYNDYIKPNLSNPKHAGHALEEMYWLLNGQTKITAEIAVSFCELVARNAKIYRPFQKELSNVFINLYRAFPSIFATQLEGVFSKNSFSEENYKALFEAGFTILFPDGLDDGDKDPEKEKCQAVYKKLITAHLFSSTKKIGNGSVQIYNVMSFIDSMCYHITLNSALYYTEQESMPQPPQNMVSLSVLVILNKWKKLLKGTKYNEKILSQCSSNISMFDAGQTEIPALVYALHTLALTSPSERTPQDVIPHIFNPSPFVSAAACRCLQTMIVMNSSLFSTIAKHIVESFNDYLLSSIESLATGINALKMIFEVVQNDKSILDQVSVTFIEFANVVFMFGLCAPHPQVRAQTIQAAKLVAELCPKFPTLGGQIIELEFEVNKTASKDVFHAARFITRNLTSTIKFTEIASSVYDNSYIFYLASFAKLVAKSPVANDSFFDLSNKLLSRCNVQDVSDQFCIFKASMALNVQSGDFQKLIQKTGSIATYNQPLAMAIICAMEPDKYFEYLEGRIFPTSLYGSILFGLRTVVDREPKEIIEENQALIFDILFLFFNYFAENGIKSEAIKPATSAPSNENLEATLNSFLEFSALSFESIYNKQASVPAGLYARVPAISDEIQLNIQPNNWFILSLNLIGVPSLTEAAQSCLTSLLALFPLPESCFEQFSESINIFTDGNPLLLSRYLIRDTQIGNFTKKAREDPKYFHALAELFPGINDPLLEIQEKAAVIYQDKSDAEDALCTAIHNSAGTILALSFNYLMGSNVLEKKSAIRLIRAIGLGTAAAHCSAKCVADVYRKISESTTAMQTHIHGSCENPAIEISTIFHKRIPVIGEQFVKEIMVLSAKKPILTKIAEPWLSKVTFSNPENSQKVLPVIVGTTSEFTCFTPYSFTEQLLSLPKNIHTLRLMRSAVEGQVKDSDDIAHFLVITIMLSHVIHGQTTGFDTTLAYLFMVRPDVVLKDMMQFLRFSFWHHQDITNGKFDALFDIDKFLDETNHQQSKPDAESDETYELFSYEEIINFVLSVLLMFSQQAPIEFKSYEPEFTAFAIICYESFKEKLEPLRSVIPAFFNGEEEVIKYFNSLPDERLNEVMTEVLAWGLCCGNSHLALRALTLFVKAAKTVDSDVIIEKATRVLFITSRCLYEKSHGLAKAAGSQWLYLMIDDKQNADWKLATKYISAVLNLIELCVRKSETPHVEVMWLASAFTQFGLYVDNPILNSAIKVIIAVLQNKGAVNEIKKQGRPKDVDGILTLISLSKFDKETAPLVFKLTSLLEQNDLVDVALSESDAAVFVFSAVNALATLTKSDESARRSLMTVGTSKQLGEAGANTAFRIFGQIASTTTGATQQLIFDFCSAFMMQTHCKIDKSTVSILAGTCDSHASTSASDRLLAIVQKRGGEIEKKQAVKTQGTIPQFPNITFFKKYDFNDLFDEDKDVFLTPSDFPPVFLNDTGFFPCSIQSSIRAVVQLAPAQPFTKWFKDLFRAQTINEQSYQFNVEVEFTAEFFNQINDILAKEEDIIIEDDEDECEAQAVSNENTLAQEEVVSQKKQTVVDWSPFLPSAQFVSSLASEICDENAPLLF